MKNRALGQGDESEVGQVTEEIPTDKASGVLPKKPSAQRKKTIEDYGVRFEPKGELSDAGVFSVARIHRHVDAWQWVIWNASAERHVVGAIHRMQDPFAAGVTATLDEAMAMVERLAPHAEALEKGEAERLPFLIKTRSEEHAFMREHGIDEGTTLSIGAVMQMYSCAEWLVFGYHVNRDAAFELLSVKSQEALAASLMGLLSKQDFRPKGAWGFPPQRGGPEGMS